MKQIKYSQILIKLKSNQIFIHYCETAEHARGMGLYPSVLAYISKIYFSQEIFIAVEKNNTSSIRGIEKAGFKSYAYHQSICLFGVVIRKVKYE